MHSMLVCVAFQWDELQMGTLGGGERLGGAQFTTSIYWFDRGHTELDIPKHHVYPPFFPILTRSRATQNFPYQVFDTSVSRVRHNLRAVHTYPLAL